MKHSQITQNCSSVKPQDNRIFIMIQASRLRDLCEMVFSSAPGRLALFWPVKRDTKGFPSLKLTKQSPQVLRTSPKKNRKKFCIWSGVSKSRLRAHSLKILAELGIRRLAAVQRIASQGSASLPSLHKASAMIACPSLARGKQAVLHRRLALPTSCCGLSYLPHEHATFHLKFMRIWSVHVAYF